MLYLNQNISAAVAAALVTGLVVGLHSIRDIDPILEANAEALSRGESGGVLANKCCPIWNVKYSVNPTSGVTVECSTGGPYKCEDCKCPY